MRRAPVLVSLIAIASVACDGDANAPQAPSAAELAARFESVADSMETSGADGPAPLMRAMGAAFRLAGDVTPLVVRFDGRARTLYGIAAQLTLPESVCQIEHVGAGPGPCDALGPQRAVRALAAVEARDLRRILLVATTATGGGEFGGPGSDPAEMPGAIAALFERRAEQLLLSSTGTITTTLVGSGDPCDALPDVPSAVRFTCARGTLDFAFTAELMELGFAAGEPPLEISMATQRVRGLVIEIVEIDVPPSVHRGRASRGLSFQVIPDERRSPHRP